jgi:hypothetical protein
MNHKLQSLLTALLVANANQQWVLPQPITVRLSDNDFDVLEIQGLQVSAKHELYIMVFADGHGYDVEQWQRLDEMYEDHDKIIDAINERVMRVYKAKVA